MISKWTAHLKTPEEKEKFEKEIRSCRLVLERLQTIMQEDLEGTETSETSNKVYDLPNWDYRQAHANGAKQTLRRYISALNLDQQENK